MAIEIPMKRLISVALLALSASVAHAADFNITSNFWRVGTTSGLGGVLNNSIYVRSNIQGSLDATRPNGQSDWTSSSSSSGFASLRLQGAGMWNGSALGDPVMDIAGAADWMTQNARGLWSVTNASGIHSFDSTSAYIAPEDRVYNELTSSSAQQYLDIVQNGSIGTFTFNLSQAAIAGTAWVLGGPGGTLQYGEIGLGSTSFTVTLASALADTVWMQVAHSQSVDGFSNTTGVAYSALISTPAPGALALFGLVGLAGRRRRD